MFTLTIDALGEESGFDLVKDFTALLIILEIDNVVSSMFIESLDLKLDSTLLPIEEFWKIYRHKNEKKEGLCIKILLVLGAVVMALGTLFIGLISINLIVLIIQFTWVNVTCLSSPAND